jgi:hypothetical protein
VVTISEQAPERKPESGGSPPGAETLQAEARRSGEAVVALAVEWSAREGAVSFKDFEGALQVSLNAFARSVIVLFLTLREATVVAKSPWLEVRAGRRFRGAPPIARNLVTMFGMVRYARRYMREVAVVARHGFFPLDQDLGLVSDRFSWNVLSAACLLATKLSFSEARATLARFVPHAPSTEVIEQSVLGLGRHTAEWFEHRPAPQGDGDVLVIMFDSKGAPTATEEELRRRRGKRRKRSGPQSPRHRGRLKRQRHPKRPRLNKGDKSKNAKMATMFVMYTLRSHGGKLLGPINRQLYASFAPKRHAFEIARREADKRGFKEGSGRLVQIVTDGDDDLATYTAEVFPTALVTIDIIHVIEKLWTAGEVLFREGSQALRDWVESQKKHLYAGRTESIFDELVRQLDRIPPTGPGNKGRRSRLDAVCNYIVKRVEKMNYDELLARDLEIGSGQVEGAIKNVIGRRFDHGGMRWIKERAEALLQLRCIEVNGDWDAFVNEAHQRMQARGKEGGVLLRLQSSSAIPLPQIRRAA